jgi:hypothetical protein
MYPGADPGGAHPARAPPKIGNNMIFWRKIVIFHTKYLNNFPASLSSAQFYAFLNGTVKIESKENVSIIEITQITAVEPAQFF